MSQNMNREERGRIERATDEILDTVVSVTTQWIIDRIKRKLPGTLDRTARKTQAKWHEFWNDDESQVAGNPVSESSEKQEPEELITENRFLDEDAE